MVTYHTVINFYQNKFTKKRVPKNGHKRGFGMINLQTIRPGDRDKSITSRGLQIIGILCLCSAMPLKCH